MYKRILVTLDQSELAERALPHAVAVAQAMSAAIELISVVPALDAETMRTAGAAYDWSGATEQTQEYLAGIRARIEEAEVAAKVAVRQGDVTEQILAHCTATGCDLIVMSTHGRSGLGRWVYGSIADRVLRYADVPVLLVRATEPGE